MSGKHFLFILNRHDIFPNDNVMIVADYNSTNTVTGEVRVTTRDISVSYPDRVGLLRNDVYYADVMEYETMVALQNVIPQYCRPTDTFAVFVHNFDDRHYEHDFIKASTLSEVFGCTLDNLVVVRSELVRQDGGIISREFSYHEYFGRLQVASN